MDSRIPVFIHATDPLSAAGTKAHLMFEPSVCVVGPADLDRARIAVVVTDAVDAALARIARAIQRDGIPRVVVVASRFDEAGVILAAASGVSGFLQRSEATPARLVQLITEVDQCGSLLPDNVVQEAGCITAGHLAETLVGTIAGVATQPREMDRVEMAGPADTVRLAPSRMPVVAPAPAASPATGVATLTESAISGREIDILRLVADGYDTSDIAEQMSYSESTIKGTLAKMMWRLEARNRCQLLAVAIRQGLI